MTSGWSGFKFLHILDSWNKYVSLLLVSISHHVSKYLMKQQKERHFFFNLIVLGIQTTMGLGSAGGST